MSLNKIAKKLGTSAETAHRRIRRLEKKGVLKGYTVTVDSIKLGYAVTAIVFVQVEGGNLLEVENTLARDGNVLSVYDITGDFDAVVFAKFKNLDSLHGFLKNLVIMRFVKNTSTMVALNVIKEGCNIL